MKRVPGLLTMLVRVNLRHWLLRSGRVGLTGVGIAAGVSLLVTVTILNATLQRAAHLTDRDPSTNADVEVTASSDSGIGYDLLRRIARVDGVAATLPVVRAITTIEGPSGKLAVLAVGLDPGATQGSVASQHRATKAIELDGSTGGDGLGLVLPRAVIDRIGVPVGGIATLATPAGKRHLHVTGRVAGAFAGAGDASFVMLSLGGAQRLFERGRAVDDAYLIVRPGSSLARVRRDVAHVASGAAVVGAPGTLSSSIEQTLVPLTTLGSLTGTIALLVAFFIVYQTSSTSLLERRREIAMAMTFGASRGQVLGAFVGEGALLGALASIAGALLGLGLAVALGVHALQATKLLPIIGDAGVQVPVVSVVGTVLAGIAVSVVGTAVPARMILGVSPAEAMRPVAAQEWRRSRGGTRVAPLLGVGAVAVAAGSLGIVATTSSPTGLMPSLTLVAWFVAICVALRLAVPVMFASAARVLRAGLGTVGRVSGGALTHSPGRATVALGALLVPSALVVGLAGAIGSYESRFADLANGWYPAPAYVSGTGGLNAPGGQPLPARLEPSLSRAPGVRHVYPFRTALVDVDAKPTLLYAYAVARARRDGEVVVRLAGAPRRVVEDVLARGDVVVSRYTARRFDVGVGSRVVVPTPQGPRRFRVGAVVEDVLASDSMYVDYDRYKRLWGDRTVTGFAVFPSSGHADGATLARLRSVASQHGVRAHVDPRADVVDKLVASVNALVALARALQLAALAIAAVTVVNVMLAMVTERGWEFGLQRLLGMTRTQVALAVLAEAATLGVIAGGGAAVLGSAIGVVVTRAMEAGFAWEIPFEPPLVIAALAIVGIAAVAVASGALPSRAATRTTVIAALRRE